MQNVHRAFVRRFDEDVLCTLRWVVCSLCEMDWEQLRCQCNTRGPGRPPARVALELLVSAWPTVSAQNILAPGVCSLNSVTLVSSEISHNLQVAAKCSQRQWSVALKVCSLKPNRSDPRVRRGKCRRCTGRALPGVALLQIVMPVVNAGKSFAVRTFAALPEAF